MWVLNLKRHFPNWGCPSWGCPPLSTLPSVGSSCLLLPAPSKATVVPLFFLVLLYPSKNCNVYICRHLVNNNRGDWMIGNEKLYKIKTLFSPKIWGLKKNGEGLLKLGVKLLKLTSLSPRWNFNAIHLWWGFSQTHRPREWGGFILNGRSGTLKSRQFFNSLDLLFSWPSNYTQLSFLLSPLCLIFLNVTQKCVCKST